MDSRTISFENTEFGRILWQDASELKYWSQRSVMESSIANEQLAQTSFHGKEYANNDWPMLKLYSEGHSCEKEQPVWRQDQIPPNIVLWVEGGHKTELSAWGYNGATLFLGDLNMGTWNSRLGESQI